MKSFEICTYLLILHLERSQSVCSSLKTQRRNKMVCVTRVFCFWLSNRHVNKKSACVLFHGYLRYALCGLQATRNVVQRVPMQRSQLVICVSSHGGSCCVDWMSHAALFNGAVQLTKIAPGRTHPGGTELL